MNSKKFTFNRNTSSNVNPAAPSVMTTNHTITSIKPTTNQTNTNQNNNDDDDDLLDISDTELIRASQVVESQLRFTNSNYHTTSNAMNIFSQFNTNVNDGLMGPPSQLPPTTIYSSSHNMDPFSQLEETRHELKSLKNENLIKDGEVKILRDKLKRTEQEMQRIRTEKADLIKKLQQQQEEAKKALQKQIELKELENQIKSQEVVELTMKYKVLESSVKKNPSNKPVIISSTPAPIANTTTTTPSLMQLSISHSTQNTQSAVFDDAFSHNNKKLMGPPTNQITNQSNSNSVTRKRMAPQASTSSLSLSDTENENPIHEPKRPNLVQNSITKTPITTTSSTTTTTTTTTPITRPPLSPFSNNSCIINPKQIKPTIKQTSTPQLTKQPSDASRKTSSYKRTCKLNLKSSLISSDSNKLDSNDKSKANEKIYKFIDLFSVSESILREFNKATQCEKTLTTNVNANNACIQNISQQLNNLLEFISYKSETSTILNDLFSSTNIKSNGSSSSSLASNSSLVLVIERVEFVSKQLNDELVKLIKYCLNVSLKDGLVITKSNQLQSTLSNDYFFKKSQNSTQIKPATMISIVDLLCLSFDVCYSLFLFRAKFQHSQNELNKRKLSNKLIKTNLNTHQNQFIYSTLVKLKQEFFKLIVIFLKSINFSSAITTTNTTKSAAASKTKPEIITKNQTTSLSMSSTSYSTLKILNSIMDCFNHLIYLPVLNKQLEPDSILTIFYFSLIDNMHNIFKNNKFNKLIQLGDQDQEMEHDHEDENEEEEDCSNEYDEDDEPCLFKLFYEKLIKYFGDIVYSLELSETTETTNTNDDVDNTNQQISIITTIAADDETTKLSNNFSTDKETTTNKLTSSKSQNDLLETLQSQTPLDDDWKQKFDFNTSNLNMNSCQLIHNDKTVSNKCIHLLQTQLLSSFIHYLHNCELFSSLEIKLINQSEQFKSSYLKSSSSQECLCYKDLLISFLILIDYQFNEKFISGAKMCISNCFVSSISSSCLDSPKLISNSNDSNLNLDEMKSISSLNCELNEKTNRFLFILIVRCCNALISFFNRTNNDQLDEKKMKFYESIKDDYRLKNFYCLYSLVDINYEELINKNKNLSLQQQNQQQQLKLNSKNESNHLYSSLNSLRSLFKTYMDDYFDLN